MSGATGRRTSGYCSNENEVSYGCNAWGAMDNFTNTGTGNNYSSGPVTADSELNAYLNNTYKNSLSELSSVQTGMTWNVGHAGTADDNLSVSEIENMEKAYTWTGDIALPTKSEYIRTNSSDSCLTASALYSNYSTCKTTNYLYKSDYWYWLLSPHSTYASNIFNALTSGYVVDFYPNNRSGSILPVLYLKSNITLTGSGTNDENIYRIAS